jgi:hypothetical protein
VVTEVFLENLVEILNGAAEVNDVTAHDDVVLGGMDTVLFPVEGEGRANGIVFLHVAFNVVQYLRLIVSNFHLPALCPFFGSHSRYSHASAKFQYSLPFELRTVIDNVTCQYDSCLPKSEAIEAVREGLETGDV